MKYSNICGHKSETMRCMELNICMSDKHHKYYKYTKFYQNPRGDPKFLVDLTWNDPPAIIFFNLCHTTVYINKYQFKLIFADKC